MSRKRPCYVVDAFSAVALGGNSAGVLLDGADLDAKAMLQIPGELLTALGLVTESLDPKIGPQKSAILEGNLYLALRDRDALARCKPDADALEAIGKRLGVAGFVVFTLNAKPGVDAAVRC